jgi:hypothetical protein
MGQVGSWHEAAKAPSLIEVRVDEAAVEEDSEEDEKRRAQLQFAFDAFVELHCELAPGTHVSAAELQSALVVYMNRVGLQMALFVYMNRGVRPAPRPDVFDHFGAGLQGASKCGTVSHPVVAGLRLKSWPH